TAQKINLKPYLMSLLEDTPLGPAAPPPDLPPGLDADRGHTGALDAVFRMQDGEDLGRADQDRHNPTLLPPTPRSTADRAVALAVALALAASAGAAGHPRRAGAGMRGRGLEPPAS